MLATTAILFGVFLSFFILERFDPLRQPKYSFVQRLAINFCVTALAFAVNAALVQPTAFFLLKWTEKKSFGLLNLVELPQLVQDIVGFLLLDLTLYYWHRANHRFSFLWRFHNAHHIDLDLDVSTGFRFHFVEIALSAGFKVIQVGLTGVSLWIYMIYELVFQANTLFHHSNVKLPLWFERSLNFVLVTPRMHGIHHSQVQEETNSNYGVVFPWWDRLHNTLRLNIPQSLVNIGVPAYSSPEDNKLQNIFLMPFRKQRDYWHQGDKQRKSDIIEENQTCMVDDALAGLS